MVKRIGRGAAAWLLGTALAGGLGGAAGGAAAVVGALAAGGAAIVGGAAEAEAAKDPPPPPLLLWNRTFATQTNADRGNLGDIAFTQNGTAVTGTYPLGTVTARVNGQVLIGRIDDAIAGRGTFTVRLDVGNYDSFRGSLRFEGKHTFNGTYDRTGNETVTGGFAMKMRPPKSVARRGLRRGKSTTIVLNVACVGPDFHPGDERVAALVIFSEGVSLDAVLPAQRVGSFEIQTVGDQPAALVFPAALGQRKDRCIVAFHVTVPADYAGSELVAAAGIDRSPLDFDYDVLEAPTAEVRVAVR